MFYAGIDWSDQHHDALVMNEAGRQVGRLRIDHTPEGLAKLNRDLSQMTGPGQKEQMACIVETSHGLLIAHLLEAGWPVYPVNPCTVDRRRAASGAKTDAIDAYLLAKTGRADFADVHRLTPDSEIVQELRTLTRDQDSLIQMQTRLVNQLTACLKDYSPVALALTSLLQQKSTLIFLQTYPTPEMAMATSCEQIAHTLKQAGHTRAKQVAPAIFETLHQPQLRGSAVTTRSKSRLMLALVAHLLPLLAHIAEYDEAIHELFLRHADSGIFLSLPRAGKRLAPRLLAEIGDSRERYPDAANLQALAGTSPVILETRDVYQNSSTLCLYQTEALCHVPIRLGDDPKRSLGPGVLPAQAQRREKPFGRRPCSRQPLDAYPSCHVVQTGAVSNADMCIGTAATRAASCLTCVARDRPETSFSDLRKRLSFFRFQ